MLKDLAGNLWSIDSRIWKTLVPLLFRPGFLSTEFLRGRRVRYLPPLRTYLVLSLIFLILSSSGLSWVSTPVNSEPGTGQNLHLGLSEDSPFLEINPDKAQAENTDADEDICASMQLELTKWLEDKRIQQHLYQKCQKIQLDHGASLEKSIVDNIPGMMFFFLPLLALFLKLLYLLSRHYYVEHLLFLVHFHAFVFLILIINTLLTLTSQLLPISEPLVDWLTGLGIVYVPVYLFIALKKFYAQSRAITTVKYLVLVFGYITSLALSLASVLVYSALTL